MPFTKQEMYERVFRYYNLPGTEFGWDDEGSACVYLTADKSKRCAVGVLIPEKEALDELLIDSTGGISDLADALHCRVEDGGPGSRMARSILSNLGLLERESSGYGGYGRYRGSNLAFLEQIQSIHDREAEDFSSMQTTYVYCDSVCECGDGDEGSCEYGGKEIPNPDAPTLIEAKRHMLQNLNAFARREGLQTLEVTL